jgi:hypothetical protein
MLRPRAAFAALLILALAVSAHARRAPRKAASQPRVDCKTLSDSLVKLYDRGDPTYLTWDFSEAKCDSSQLYTAYYYQGIGFLFISAWKEALYFLNAARAIGGPKDEEILYHLWTVYRKLDRYPEMERLTLELHQRYPGSLFLLEILDQWKGVKSPSRIAWNVSSKAGMASNPYLDHLAINRIQAESRQKAGPHQFRETGSMSLTSKWDERLLHSFQGNVGGEYEWKGFSAEANWGVGYESRRADTSSLLLTSGAQSILVDSNWNFVQGRAAVGYSLTTGSGWNLGWNASFFLLSKDWRVASLSHSQSFLFPDFILIAYLDLQKHWIDNPDAGDILLAGTPLLDGMHTLSFNLTPYFSFGRHSFGFGPTYYVSRWHYAGEALAGGTIDETGWQHSVSGTASYGYDWRHWCRLAFSGSYGYDFGNDAGTRHWTAKPVYAADGGISLSF